MAIRWDDEAAMATVLSHTLLHAAVLCCAGCATVAEVRKRGDEFWKEFEFYLSDMLVGEWWVGGTGGGAWLFGQSLLPKRRARGLSHVWDQRVSNRMDSWTQGGAPNL